MPAYRCYLFPNLFELNDERYALLRETVLRDGRMAVFGPATGITDGKRLSADGISKLMGVEYELMRLQAPRRVLLNHANPITRDLPANTVFGDSYPFGPILLPTRAACDSAELVTLGSAIITLAINRAGLALREFGRGGAGNGTPGPRGADDYAVVWSAAIPLPPALLRECARYGGCHVWCEEDDVVLASDTIAALHSGKPGPRRLALPGPRRVVDLLTGVVLGDGLTAIDFNVDAPETRIFFHGEASIDMERILPL
ncbi:MAG: hypothetical protein BWY76_03320 [bacterium ADurb.Bin429]|nr:MAG: hypothetical protein BWY76_03320 [bacterium ADurb.Bin429]